MLNLERLSDITHELSSNLVRSIVLPRGFRAWLSGHGTRAKQVVEGSSDSYVRSGMVVLCAPGPFPDDAIVAAIRRVGTRAFRAVVLTIEPDVGTSEVLSPAAGPGSVAPPDPEGAAANVGTRAPACAGGDGALAVLPPGEGAADSARPARHHDRSANHLPVTGATGEFPGGSPAVAATRALRRYGIQKVDVVAVPSRRDADREELSEQVREAQTVVIVASDAAAALEVLVNTALHQALSATLQLDHTVIAAGQAASLVGKQVVVGAASASDAVVVPGLSLLPEFVLTCHRPKEGGTGALHALGVHLAPQQIGVVLDSGAVLAIRGSEARVLGDGTVLVADAREASTLCDGTLSLPVSSPAPGGVPSVCGLRVHILTPGCGLNLLSRRPTGPFASTGPSPPERAVSQL